MVAVGGSIPASPTIRTLGSGFNTPHGVAVDGSGNVYVADSGNGAVKEMVAVGGSIPASPTILTLGSGFSFPSGVAVDGSGNVYVGDTLNNAVYEIEAASVNFGAVNVASTSTALSLQFTFDTGGTGVGAVVLTQGAAGLDFTDAGGTCTTNGPGHSYNSGDTCTVNVIFTPKRAWTRYGAATLTSSSGTVIATGYVHGTGSGPQVAYLPGMQSTLGSGFSFPFGGAVDGSGNVYVADSFNSAVKEMVAVGGSIPASPTILTLGSGFSQPYGVAVDGSGNVYVADEANHAVYEMVAVDGSIPASPTIRTLGSGFSAPAGVAVDGSGNVYVADFGNAG
jgi:sugar lactone lactonase YvrE